MSKVKQTVYGIVKGKFLVEEDALKNWGLILFLTFLALLMISSSHNIDRKVQKISELNKEYRELRSKFVATRSDLMKLKMESRVKNELESKGFYTYVNPPQKIKVKVNK